MDMIDLEQTQLEATRERCALARDVLQRRFAELRGSSDHWSGQLSTSALSTATAISALSICVSSSVSERWDSADETGRYSVDVWRSQIELGCQWLSRAQNSDGGFGDTNRSKSNIATTYLVIAAWHLAGAADRYADQLARANAYVERSGSWDGLRQRYGKDKTFVVPIMTNCALAGLVDWKRIPSLPFEAAVLPQSWYRFVQLPVVSYAVPALVAIGQAHFRHCPPRNPVMRIIREASCKPSLRVLERMQPTSGGYLEAVPLTSFVLMSLGSIGLGQTRVARMCRKFIIDSILPDGSWPIDTNLATWVTSLSTAALYGDACEAVNKAQVAANVGSSVVANTSSNSTSHVSRSMALKSAGDNCDTRDDRMELDRTVDWILSCQHRCRHPFTGAEPGGWGWTNLSGAVPDADDTPAALLALHVWYQKDTTYTAEVSALREARRLRVLEAVGLGLRWLVRLQNRDGGWPTFCRGWGTLPFDRSGSDLTAHAIRAISVWQQSLSQQRLGKFAPSASQLEKALSRGWRYLERQQRPDGSWIPLWFGNQDRAEEDNPIYGTGRVLLCYGQCGRTESAAFQRGKEFLLKCQNDDGGWGGGTTISYEIESESGKPHVHASPESSRSGNLIRSTLEETAVALEGIMFHSGTMDPPDPIIRGLNCINTAIEGGHHSISQPIGFYFARLWYHEQMYPLVFPLSALKRGIEFCQR